jgi:ribosomal protein S27AE
MRKRGRSRKHNWIEFQNIENDCSHEAQYLRWVSVNNPALAQRAQSGCPRCSQKKFRLRHDKKFNNVRFYCPECRFETSYHIIPPKKSLHTIEIHDTRGMLIGLKNVDDYHDKTSRENADTRVMLAERKLDLGGEWFDGISGTNSQSRYLSREEILKRIEERKMKKLMKAALEEIENEEREYHDSAIETDILGEDMTDVGEDVAD